MRGRVLVAGAAVLCAVVCAAEVQVMQSKETLSIKNKLETAEGRVSDLISRLDAVSGDATRAKNEIHSTLMEVWQIVDLLGRDRCGDVVDKVRIAQKKAERKVAEQEEEIRIQLKDIEKLKLQVSKSSDVKLTFQNEIKAERSRRETLETEARELRDKLHWASAVSNETQKYELVAERLQNLIVVVSERATILNRIMTMIGDAQSGYADWRKETESIAGIIRNAERDFSSAGGFQNAAAEGLRRRSEELERRLQDALQGRESIASERNTLRQSMENMQRKLTSATSSLTGSGGNTRERIVVEDGMSWIGVLTLCIVSLCTGGIVVFFLGAWQSGREQQMSGADKYGFSSTPNRTASPAFHHNTASPMTYAGGSASKTPGSATRGSTPRRY